MSNQYGWGDGGNGGPGEVVLAVAGAMLLIGGLATLMILMNGGFK